MAIIKPIILKNTTTSNINLSTLGVVVPAGSGSPFVPGERDVSLFSALDLRQDPTLISSITVADIIVNNGIDDILLTNDYVLGSAVAYISNETTEDPILVGTGAINIPSGPDSDRTSPPRLGDLRINTQEAFGSPSEGNFFEIFFNAEWTNLSLIVNNDGASPVTSRQTFTINFTTGLTATEVGGPDSGIVDVVNDFGSVAFVGSPAPNTNDLLQFNGTDWTNVTTSSIAGVFGSEFDETSSEGESSTSSTTYQNKVTLTTASLPSGTYRIGFYCETRSGAGNTAVEVQVDLNNGTILANFSEEPDDSDNVMPNGGFKYETLSGVNTIDIDWRVDPDETGGTAFIRRARIELWRVS